MKRLLCLLLLAPTTLLAQKQTLPIDQKASTLTWTGHAEIGTYAPAGSLSVQGGQIVFDKGSLLGATIVVDMASMTQANADLVHHLKSADFFDVEHFPTATIQIDRVSNATVFGSMTIKGKSAPFQAPVKVTGAANRFTITGKVTVDRTSYGITYNSPSFFSSLGDKAIRNTFEVEFSFTGTGIIPERYRS